MFLCSHLLVDWKRRSGLRSHQGGEHHALQHACEHHARSDVILRYNSSRTNPQQVLQGSQRFGRQYPLEFIGFHRDLFQGTRDHHSHIDSNSDLPLGHLAHQSHVLFHSGNCCQPSSAT